MTAPSAAEFRAYAEAALADWAANQWVRDELDQSDAFQEFIDSEHVADEDFEVFFKARGQALADLGPAISAALRPFLIEAEVRAALAFFERFPDAPLAKQLVSA